MVIATRTSLRLAPHAKSRILPGHQLPPAAHLHRRACSPRINFRPILLSNLNSPIYCLMAGAASQWKCLPRRCSLSGNHDRSSVNPWRKSKDVSVPIPSVRLAGRRPSRSARREGRGLDGGWDGGPDIRTIVLMRYAR